MKREEKFLKEGRKKRKLSLKEGRKKDGASLNEGFFWGKEGKFCELKSRKNRKISLQKKV